ncbi:hypothetical protein MJ1_0757 [Nanobdella aerobiophila]|uniref:Uncharacterized protein n=1 Tax=Nanobdella aerobiophila TaxID=2586965 RepID=A0A915WSF8_9ARCH|nr:hypothetical protein [Nanobdella aerobiophila]BBL45896.1 hypothetical protein MJ1_0757 [Nanobdella aerobiophila]
MKSQFILLYLVLILFITLVFLSKFDNNYYYKNNFGYYIGQDFYVKLLLYPNESFIINNTYYNICLEENIICYYNGTNIVIMENGTEYIFKNP